MIDITLVWCIRQRPPKFSYNKKISRPSSKEGQFLLNVFVAVITPAVLWQIISYGLRIIFPPFRAM